MANITVPIQVNFPDDWLERIIDRLRNDPDAEWVERKTGKWLIDGHHIKCDKCGEYMCRKDYEGEVIPRNFCPNCGAKMEGIEC